MSGSAGVLAELGNAKCPWCPIPNSPFESTKMKIARSLGDILALKKMEAGVYLGLCHEPNVNGVIFGGQLLAQTTLAALLEAPADCDLSSFQLAFSRPGRPDTPLEFRVEHTGDRKNFSTRSVVARQNDNVVAMAHVTLQRRGSVSKLGHWASPNETTQPEDLPDASVFLEGQGKPFEGHMARILATDGLAQVRLIDPETYLYKTKADASFSFWIRLWPRIGNENLNRQAVVAYLSDVWIVYAAILPRIPFDKFGIIRIGSINHTLWFFGAPPSDDWLLVQANSPIAAVSRGLTLARIHDRSGRLVAMSSVEAVYSASVGG